MEWPSDTFTPSSPAPTSLRSDRPRLIAPKYKWDALPSRIPNEPYLKLWNTSIFQNATAYYSLPPVVYHLDGASGILDNAREVKMRIKAFAYVARMTNDTKWVDRAWAEIQVGNLINLNEAWFTSSVFVRMLQEMGPHRSGPPLTSGIQPISSMQQNSPLPLALLTTGYTIFGPLIRSLRFVGP